jgi:exonuclease III
MRLPNRSIRYRAGRHGRAVSTRVDRVRTAAIDTTTEGSDHRPVVVEP